MLRITADVNGKVIGHLFVHNTGRKHRYMGEWWAQYDAAFWNGEDGIIGIEGVSHIRSDHWLNLVNNVLREMPRVSGVMK